MRHWPETLLAGLLLIGSWGTVLLAPGGWMVKLASVVASWVGVFAIWFAVLWVACWLHDKRESKQAESSPSDASTD